MQKGDFIVAILKFVGLSGGHWLDLSGMEKAQKTSESSGLIFSYCQVGMPRYLLRGGEFLTESCNALDYGTLQKPSIV